VGHADQWRRAGKVLRPASDGFEAKHEVDGGEGFMPYYVIFMQLVAAPTAI
jgi:hypothetical protein